MIGKWRKALRQLWQEPEAGRAEEKDEGVKLGSRFSGCLLAGAAGDALGYAVEFMDETAIDKRMAKRGSAGTSCAAAGR